MNNSSSKTRPTHRQTWITTYRVVTTVLLMALVVIASILLARPAPTSPPTATEIAEAVNGPADFQRPSAMEYVAKTDSCVVGGTLVATTWHVGSETFGVAEVDSDTVDYTVYEFLSDEGRTFNVSANGALWGSAGENYGLELYCDPVTMNTAPSFGLRAIIYGGI